MGDIVLGVDLGGTNIKAGAVTAEGSVPARLSISTPEPAAGPQAVAHAIAEAARSVMKKLGLEPAAVRGVGIGSPGTIDLDAGMIGVSPNLPQLNGAPLRDMVEDDLGLQCVLENDANAAAMAENWVGAGRDAGSIVLVTLGTGIGGGIVLDGQIWHGLSYAAGEVGHMCIDPDGPPCPCGSRGCWERYGSATAMVARMRGSIRAGVQTVLTDDDTLSAQAIHSAALDGDAAALENIRETGRYIGVGVSNLLHILNPEVVAFSGGVTAAGDMLLDPIRQEVQARTLPFSRRNVRICYSEVPHDAGLIGAARCCMATWEAARRRIR